MPHSFFIVLFLLVGLSRLAAVEAVEPWISSEASGAPVARIYDTFMVTPRGTDQSSGAVNQFVIEQGEGGVPVLNWTVSLKDQVSEERARKAWALCRGVFPDAAWGKVVGVRVCFYASQSGEVRGQFFRGAEPKGKGFWPAKLVSQEKLRYESGFNELTFYVGRDELEKWGNRINSFGLKTDEAPVQISLESLSLVFSSEAAAKDYARQMLNDKRRKLETMLSWVEVRGVPLVVAAEDIQTVEDERTIWRAAQLLSMVEQVNYWLSMAKYHHLSDAVCEEGDKFQDELKSLTAGFTSLERAPEQSSIDSLQQAIDAWITSVQSQISLEDRRWTTDETGKRFLRANGELYRMFGPFFFRSIYRPGNGRDNLWDPWDMRYISALGFNGIRLTVTWKWLEPERGKLDPAYVAMLREIMQEAERYGLGVSIDLHWPYPQWFMNGPEGRGPLRDNIDHHNAYHWPEALAESWSLFAEAMQDIPNIVAFEVPANETPIGRGELGIKAYPALLESWNQWLKDDYGAREALEAAWQNDVLGRTYMLQATESWDDNSIEPLGFQGDLSPEEAYEHNPRFWDHVRWAAWVQESTTGQILAEIREYIPSAEGMFQYTIGDVWDKSSVPVNYQAISTLYGEGTLPGTHYGMGGVAARKAAALTLKSYDSEQQMEGRRDQVYRHVALGLGFCPFAFHARGGGGMLFSDDDWYLKESVAYLPKMAEWIRTYWPEENAGHARRIAFIENTQRVAAGEKTFGELDAIAARYDIDLAVFEGLRIVRNPELLEGYDGVILDSGWLDSELLERLNQNYDGYVLLYGVLDYDAFARGGTFSTISQLAAAGRFFKEVDFAHSAAAALDFIDLEGQWQAAFVDSSEGEPKRSVLSGAKWRPIHVPSFWGEVEILGSSLYHMGDVWYRKEVELPASWKGRDLTLEAGAIDDFDWVYFNGKLIGKTTQDRANWWSAPRSYKLPSNLTRWGDVNTLEICVRNTNDDGGIYKGPVRISSSNGARVVWSDTALDYPLELSPHSTLLLADAVSEGVALLATVQSEEGASRPAYLRDWNWFWWIGDSPWGSDRNSEAVLTTFFEAVDSDR
ncbi:cellulase family glycosylhydrolase [Cerasicoccus frondis]|uniref:cellulase family glycosylhydrolase n=1 Tax=Cerasicoccus frondis TaxID=490090 RepID=UPI002852801F|nr:cellulase family glycosylhydrolase [Cerasicoccus frondis]